jgi:hypothetical protein
MRRLRISVNGFLPGTILYAAIIALIRFRRRVRALVLEEFPNELSLTTINRLANVYRDIDELEWWEQTPPDEIKARFGDETEATLQRMKESRDYFADPGTPIKHFNLILTCEALNNYFRAVRACEPADWDRAEKILDDQSIPFFEYEREQIGDYLFALQMDAETLLRLTYLEGERLGEIRGMRLQAVAVASSGGRARAKKLKATDEQARAQIRRYISRHREPSSSSDTTNPQARARKLSASAIASAMIHGEMSELGYRTLANIASEELAAYRAKQTV